MHTKDHNSNFNFLEEDKFLQNILELRKITSELLKSRDEMNASIQRLNDVVHSLYREIHESDNK